MPHYICKGGCKGVSDKPGVCQTDDCANHNHRLEECDCVDGKHYGAFEDAELRQKIQKEEEGEIA